MRLQRLLLASTAFACLAQAGVIGPRAGGGLLDLGGTSGDPVSDSSNTPSTQDTTRDPSSLQGSSSQTQQGKNSDVTRTDSSLGNTLTGATTGSSTGSTTGSSESGSGLSSVAQAVTSGTGLQSVTDAASSAVNSAAQAASTLSSSAALASSAALEALAANGFKNCKNTPTTRQCWGGKLSCTSDFHKSWPTTERVRRYYLEITNRTMSLDGVPRMVFPVNGQVPGPTIIADWGDILEIHVTNRLRNNGTSIHWHGIRQLGSNFQDGVNGITECPLAPGMSKVYRFQCTQFGTSWYHSHYSGQYGDGVYGGILINGPSTANYDEDLGTLTVGDWFHTTAAQVGARAMVPGLPPAADNGLINGTMVSPDGTAGRYHRTKKLVKGKKYLLRLINTSMNDHFQVGIDGHNLTVVSADFVPVNPVVKDWVFLAVGQRHNVIFTADDPDGTGLYWLRAQGQNGCSANNNAGNIRSIIQYQGTSSSAIPGSEMTPYTDRCLDTPDMVPYVAADVDQSGFESQVKDFTVAFAPGPNQVGDTVVFWTVNGQHTTVNWEYPTVQYVANRRTDFPANASVILLDKPNVWTYWVVQTGSGQPFTVPHPIHLHGHDFQVLGQGTGQFDVSMVGQLQFDNPMRRDVAMLPAGGWLVIAFETDNPGAWLMHCHIAWHVGEGLSVQFLERRSEIRRPGNDFYQTCQQWNRYYRHPAFVQDDSGI